MESSLHFVLTAPAVPPELPSVDTWWPRLLELSVRFPAPADLALAGGFHADRLGFAFASGYQAALRALLPELPSHAKAALCATEEGGAHPGVLQTRLEREAAGGYRLSGRKTYVTLGTAAERLLVVASEGRDSEGRNRLRLVQVDARSQGVTCTALPPTPFVPEVPHASVTFDGVTVAPEDVLPGDGYVRYLKPFRTVEDCHVHLALLGWLIQVGRRSDWPQSVRDAALAHAVTFHALAKADVSSSAVHVALAGALAQVGRLLDEVEALWARVDAPTRERWERDRRLLAVAGKARAQRSEAARRRLMEEAHG
ncbi:MAG: acyl-CoA dehydrogenase family protein [Myxococcaceae bacterium]|nr:acyl-CoA dehydrogenase family protein [Myxococcaceae bacterium]